MKKNIFLFVLFSIVLLVACSNDSNSVDKKMSVNGKVFSYDEILIDVIDKSKRINKLMPPTLKTPYPEFPPQYKVEVTVDKEKETYTLWERETAYLIRIQKTKKDEDFWLELSNKEYENAHKALKKYKEVKVSAPLTIFEVESKFMDKYQSSSSRPVGRFFVVEGYEQQSTCFLKNECITFYQGETSKDADEIKKELQDSLASMNLMFPAKVYSIENIVLLYLPSDNSNVLKKDIEDVIGFFNEKRE